MKLNNREEFWVKKVTELNKHVSEFKEKTVENKINLVNPRAEKKKEQLDHNQMVKMNSDQLSEQVLALQKRLEEAQLTIDEFKYHEGQNGAKKEP